MPIVLKKTYTITGNYTQEQLSTLQGLVDDFRLHMADDDPQKNILSGKVLHYSDNTIVALLKSAIADINKGYPRTKYTLFNFQNSIIDDGLIIDGAMIFALIREGILQLRNQIDYNDSGLSIAMFNKTGMYQSWVSFLLQQYESDKKEFKSAIIASSENSGFIGIGSEFSYRMWR